MEKLGKDVYIQLGKALEKHRKEKGYSLREAAELVGCSNPTIMRAEKAQVVMSEKTLQKYCDVLGVDMQKLLFDARMDAIFRNAGSDLINELASLAPNDKEEELIMKIRELPEADQEKVYLFVEDLYTDIAEETNEEIRREKEKR